MNEKVPREQSSESPAHLQENEKGPLQPMTNKKQETLLTLYTPSLEELWFKQEMLKDPSTMAYNRAWGGTIAFPRERWSGWYDLWIADFSSKRFYRYLRDSAGLFVGEVAYHFDEARGLYLADVLVHAPYRSRGYGRAGLRLLCAAAKVNGVKVLHDDIAADNPAVSLFLEEGFIEVTRTSGAILLKKEL